MENPGLARIEYDIADSRRCLKLFTSDANQHFWGLIRTVYVS
jgi:hypothetical protein